MAYTRTSWVSGETPLSAENMNNIEDGIEELGQREAGEIPVGTYTDAVIPYEKVGNICIVQIRTLKNLPAGEASLGTLPTGFRPSYSIENILYSPTSTGTNRGIRIRIDINGVISAYNYGSAATGAVNLRGQLSFICV